MMPSASPSTVASRPPGSTSAITLRKRAVRRSGDTPARASRSLAQRCASSSPSPPYRAEVTPGAPPRASTSRPESSPIASMPVAAAAARALPRAFSRYDSAPSGGSVTPGKSASRRTRRGRSLRRLAISRALPGLALATTSTRSEGEGLLPARGHRAPLQAHERADAPLGQREQLGEAVLAERRLLGGALHLHEGAP